MKKAKNLKYLAHSAIAALLLLLPAEGLFAAGSDSFGSDDASITNATNFNATSTTYQSDGTVTWRTDGQSDSYQVSISPADGDAGSTTGGSTGGTGGGGVAEEGGGRRGSGSQASAQSSSDASRRSDSGLSSARSAPPPVPIHPAAPLPLPPLKGYADELQQQVLPVTSPDGSRIIHFFRAVDPLCAPCNRYECPAAGTEQVVRPAAPPQLVTLSSVAYMTVGAVTSGVALFVAGALRSFIASRKKFLLPFLLPLTYRKKEEEKKKKKKRRSHKALRSKIVGLLLIVCTVSTLMPVRRVVAEDTTPDYRMYNGTLRNAQGAAITTAHRIRFSYWRSTDAVAGDLTASGTINPAAANFLGWTEVHTVTPNAQGNFFVKLGSIQQINLFEKISADDARNLHLQVEVKQFDAPLTSFEILDIKPSDPLVDRTPILPVPTARNADLLDLRDTGTGSGQIAVLQTGGLLPVRTVPGATNSGSFVIDANNTETSEISLKFGTTLAKKLSYDIANGRFNFNDDLRVQGDLTVTGLINGVDITNLSNAANTHLKVSSGAGLTINVAGGGYRLNGDLTYYAGNSGVAVPDNATSYVFFGSGGLTIRSLPFPTDESFIPLATVITSGGAITGVTDKRVLQDDDRESNVMKAMHPAFENASVLADGADNVGQLVVGYDGAANRNFYKWTSSRTALQDYTIILPFTLPSDFVRWQTSPVSVFYKSSSANSAENKLDIQILDTAGNNAGLSGSFNNLVSTTWISTALGFTGAPSWTPGQTIMLKFTVSAKDPAQMYLGEVQLKYVTLQGN